MSVEGFGIERHIVRPVLGLDREGGWRVVRRDEVTDEVGVEPLGSAGAVFMGVCGTLWGRSSMGIETV